MLCGILIHQPTSSPAWPAFYQTEGLEQFASDDMVLTSESDAMPADLCNFRVYIRLGRGAKITDGGAEQKQP